MQVAARADEAVPATQARQDAEPAAEKVPARHVAHCTKPAPEKVPAAHASHAPAASDAAYVPGKHAVQAADFPGWFAFEKLPAAHAPAHVGSWYGWK